MLPIDIIRELAGDLPDHTHFSVGDNSMKDDYRRSHSALLEALGFIIMLPVEVVVKLPLKTIVALHDALQGKSGRPPDQHRNNRNLN